VSAPFLLAVDVGNTNVTLGTFDYASGEGRLGQHWRLATHREQTSDEVGITLRALFEQARLDTGRVTDVILSSVVPPLLPIWERVSTKLFDHPPLVVGPGIKTGMPVRYENPREVGADRVVNAVAAFELMGGPVIAVDFGTATTFDCVSREGEFVGGAIYPGVFVSLEALVSRASRLSSVEIVRPPNAIGKNTAQNLQSGMVFGYAGMVDTMVRRLRKELGEDARVIATGGLASLIASETETIERVEPFLTLEGLRLIYERNREPPKEE
jgi:type III pantothenate kinase